MDKNYTVKGNKVYMNNSNDNRLDEFLDLTNLSSLVKERIKLMFHISSAKNESNISLEFEDFKGVLEYGGEVFCDTVSFDQKILVEKNIQLIIENILQKKVLKKAGGILVFFVTHPDMKITKITNFMDYVHDNAHEDANIIFGFNTDDSLDVNNINLYILVTGIKND